MVLRAWKFENGIFRNCGGHSQPHDFPCHSTPCWCCGRCKQTAMAQVPEGTVVQKQPSLQPSCLTVSDFGQHKTFNRTYRRTMYTPHHKEYTHTHHSYRIKFVEDLFQLQGGIFRENKIFTVVTDFVLFINGSVIFYTLQNFKEFLPCVSACTQIKRNNMAMREKLNTRNRQ